VATNAYYITDRRMDRTGWGIDEQSLPVKAAQFLVQNGLNGRMLNDLDFGGWLDWQAPQPTFIDGRLEVPEESFFRQIQGTFAPGGLIPLLSAAEAQLVVIEFNSASPWVDQLNRFSNWRLIYLDENTAIYAKEDYAPQILALSLSGFIKTLNLPDETEGSLNGELKGLRPSKFRSWLRGFYLPQTYAMGDFSMGLFALRSRAYQPALDLLMEGFRRTNGDYGEVFFNLAVANLHLENFEFGRRCLEYTLELDPKNEQALEMLKI
jgi:tetratricopeptide (TPR) repeat protein